MEFVAFLMSEFHNPTSSYVQFAFQQSCTRYKQLGLPPGRRKLRKGFHVLMVEKLMCWMGFRSNLVRGVPVVETGFDFDCDTLFHA